MEERKKEKSCGCIIIENDKVLLIQQVKGHWGFPKGHMEKGETEQQTAIREVKEETNINVKIISDKKYTMEYITNKGKQKNVILFLAKKIGGEEKYQEDEVKAMEWLSFDEAIKTITHDNTRELFKDVLKDLN